MRLPSERDHQQRVNARRVEDHGALAEQHLAALRDDLVEVTAATIDNRGAFGGGAQDLEPALDIIAVVGRVADRVVDMLVALSYPEMQKKTPVQVD